MAAGTYRAICVNSDKETHRILGKEHFETLARQDFGQGLAAQCCAQRCARDCGARDGGGIVRREQPVRQAQVGKVAPSRDDAGIEIMAAPG